MRLHWGGALMKIGSKWFWRVSAVLVVLALAGGGWSYLTMRSMGFFRTPVFETERPALPQMQHLSVLVFSKTNSFIHTDAIPAAKALLQQMGAEQGWSVFEYDGGGVFNAEDLARFDVVVWSNVSGNVLLPEQRAAMQAWMVKGGGFVALHAAGDNSHAEWPWYLDTVIGARFIGHPMHPQFQQARLRIEQPDDPIMAGLPDPWMRTDEWYSWEKSPRAPGVRVLATIDETSYNPVSLLGRSLRMGADHPMIWARCIGRGRVFYSALGHTAESYAEPEYREVLRRAIAWAGRMEQGAAAAGAPLECESSAEEEASHEPT